LLSLKNFYFFLIGISFIRCVHVLFLIVKRCFGKCSISSASSLLLFLSILYIHNLILSLTLSVSVFSWNTKMDDTDELKGKSERITNSNWWQNFITHFVLNRLTIIYLILGKFIVQVANKKLPLYDVVLACYINSYTR
jgi:hypothetical protein